MKKIQFLLAILVAFVFTACEKNSGGENVHGGGSFLIPLIGIVVAIGAFLYAYKQSKSGSLIGGSSDDPIISDGKGNVPIYKTGLPFVIGVAAVILTIVYFFVQNAEK